MTSRQLNDCIYAADGYLLDYYQANGATSGDLNKAQEEFLIAQGATPGNMNDMWEEFLLGLGYTGALNDMLVTFWCDDGGVVTPCEAPTLYPIPNIQLVVGTPVNLDLSWIVNDPAGRMTAATISGLSTGLSFTWPTLSYDGSAMSDINGLTLEVSYNCCN